MRCTRVETWVYGYITVKFDTEKEPVKKALLGMRHCPEDATITVEHAGFTFHWCPEHAADPTCGAGRKD